MITFYNKLKQRYMRIFVIQAHLNKHSLYCSLSYGRQTSNVILETIWKPS